MCKNCGFLGVCVLGGGRGGWGGVPFSLLLGFFQSREHSSPMNVIFDLCLNCKLQDSDYEMSDSFSIPCKTLSPYLLHIAN